MEKIKIIDDFLNKEDFKKLCSLKLDDIPSNSIKVYHNEIGGENVINNNFVEKSFIEVLHKNYHKKAMKILEELNYEKAKLYDYSDFTIIKTGKNYKFPIHDDTPNKLLSGVIYLFPTKNSGTIFYSDKKGNSKKTIEWKQNRGVFFSRIEGESWHSYQGDGNSDRIALVYNLMTKKIKDVYKLENKNYFLGSLRWKINPYLLKYFKFTV